MKNSKQDLVNRLIEVLKEDIDAGDVTVLDEILMQCPNTLLINSLPEEEWKNYTSLIENENKPTKLQNGWIKQANKYLHFNEDGSDQTVLNVIAKIRDHADQDVTIDVVLGDDENVFPLEDFEYRFTCKSFLVMIGYKYK
jgi:hypothetical protein